MQRENRTEEMQMGLIDTSLLADGHLFGFQRNNLL